MSGVVQDIDVFNIFREYLILAFENVSKTDFLYWSPGKPLFM